MARFDRRQRDDTAHVSTRPTEADADAAGDLPASAPVVSRGVQPATGTSEVAHEADFSSIRYAQCWEDADVLIEALDIHPGDTCVSIASGGDNTLALLTKDPAHVIALDLSPAQLACLELRVAAYRALRHPELLELIGSVASSRRPSLYARCRDQLSDDARAFWDARPELIAAGTGAVGKFERYFALFRRRILPLVESRAKVELLLRGGPAQRREAFYATQWDSWRWRLMFRLFFSRFVMGRAGRDPRFFQYVEGSVADRILARTRYALTMLDPADNPYVQWILTGRHTTALPYALRPEHFEVIRANLGRLEWRCQSLEDYLARVPPRSIDRFNLSDIFEYMSEQRYTHTLGRIAATGRPGGRLAYWNMLVPRSRPEALADRLAPLAELAAQLHQQDKAFFYSALVVEEIR
jgi:S-adenosylmethionine-diacylglycerol 3-amino-3-carboxypropyl transferase